MPLKRSLANPILTRDDLPDVLPRLRDASSVFNPAAVIHEEQYHLILRVQARSRETFLMPAVSDDGVRFRVEPRLLEIDGIAGWSEKVYHIYDPRLTVIDGHFHLVVALDVDGGTRLAVARGDTLDRFELVGVGAEPDIRNGVLFPEKFGGRYVRLDRPNRTNLPGGPRSGEEICLSSSDDLVHWTNEGPVLQGRSHYWDELIGSGPPPIKTWQGWLHLYHGVATHFGSTNIYQTGALLLDLDNPKVVVARSRQNILEPRAAYELAGQVPNVVFPTGITVDRFEEGGFAHPQACVRIYYGAADTCVGLATATVAELVEACHE